MSRLRGDWRNWLPAVFVIACFALALFIWGVAVDWPAYQPP